MQKHVLITGCSRGLGLAMARQFAATGWTVSGCARSVDALEKISAELSSPNFFSPCDVSDDSTVRQFCAEVIASCGVPDLVLNNAAMVNPNAPLWEIDDEAFARIFAINVKGTASVMRHLLPPMMKKGGGVIVNFSSGWGRSASPEVAPYCATKWAIEGLSQAAAQETQGKVAIIPLNPGIIDTVMLRSCFGNEAAYYPKAEDWARQAVPLLVKLGLKDNGRQLTAPS